MEKPQTTLLGKTLAQEGLQIISFESDKEG
jgi:hypothetical protein